MKEASEITAGRLAQHVDEYATDAVGVTLGAVVLMLAGFRRTPFFEACATLDAVSVFYSGRSIRPILPEVERSVEVNELDSALATDHDVVRLQVTVGDALLVKVTDGAEQLCRY